MKRRIGIRNLFFFWRSIFYRRVLRFDGLVGGSRTGFGLDSRVTSRVLRCFCFVLAFDFDSLSSVSPFCVRARARVCVLFWLLAALKNVAEVVPPALPAAGVTQKARKESRNKMKEKKSNGRPANEQGKR